MIRDNNITTIRIIEKYEWKTIEIRS